VPGEPEGRKLVSILFKASKLLQHARGECEVECPRITSTDLNDLTCKTPETNLAERVPTISGKERWQAGTVGNLLAQVEG
jgi:hypothetical protein